MTYEERIKHELDFWEFEQLKKPGKLNQIAQRLQKKINGLIPQKVHNAITAVIKQMINAVLFGAKHTTFELQQKPFSFLHAEALIKRKIENYCKVGATEGGITGAGGFFMGLADFPALIAIKIKLLFEIANLYGFSIKDYRERLFILYIFQLAFSNNETRTTIYLRLKNWNDTIAEYPVEATDFDWQTFQQEYRDYIDLAKMAQLLPVVGAAVGAVANYQLLKKLGKTAMMCYRMRLLNKT